MRGWIKSLIAVGGLAAAFAGGSTASADTTRTLSVGGVERAYRIHLPPQAGKTPLPLVFFFHGAGGSSEQAARGYGWEDLADKKGFAVAFPQGLPVRPDRPANFFSNPHVWRDGRYEAHTSVDDLAFFRQMLADIEAHDPIDRRRVFVAGFSNGASLAFRLGGAFPERIAAIGPVCSSSYQAPASLARPVPVIYLIGTEDPLNPYQGGKRVLFGREETMPPLPATVETWRRLDGCPATPQIVRADHGVQEAVYGPGREGSEVVVYTLSGMGHHWPGGQSPHRFGDRFGPAIDPIPATAIIWDFFARHPLSDSGRRRPGQTQSPAG